MGSSVPLLLCACTGMLFLLLYEGNKQPARRILHVTVMNKNDCHYHMTLSSGSR